MGNRSVAACGLLLLTVLDCGTAFADEPSSAADAPLYYSRRGEAGGDSSSSLVQPSLFTGAAQMSVPISIPAGAGGVQPDLAMSYNSSRGRGNLGTGWSIELPKIVRSTKYGADQARSAAVLSAVYVLDGEELLKSAITERDPFS